MGNSVQLMMSLFWAVPYFLKLLIISHQKEPIIGGEAIISNIAHWKSCTKYFALLSHYFLKIITSNKLNMDFLSVPSLFL